jgi:hypothetical protein
MLRRIRRVVSWARGTFTLQLECGHADTIFVGTDSVQPRKPTRRMHWCKECALNRHRKLAP